MIKFIPPIEILESDGAKDVVNCGEGNDEIWINTSIDSDEFSTDCESINKG